MVLVQTEVRDALINLGIVFGVILGAAIITVVLLYPIWRAWK